MSLMRQGDVLLVPASLPDGAKKQKRQSGRLVLAEGEATGHAHAVLDRHVDLLVSADEAAELYLLVHGTESATILHEEHAPVTVPPGTYRVQRQREYSPAEIRQVGD